MNPLFLAPIVIERSPGRLHPIACKTGTLWGPRRLRSTIAFLGGPFKYHAVKALAHIHIAHIQRLERIEDMARRKADRVQAGYLWSDHFRT